MTKYFKNFNFVGYNFGNNEEPVIFNNLTQYVDVLDALKDNISFYNKHTILSGERPDTLSFKLYGTTDYYWTFFLMNDNVRLSGWPLGSEEILDEAKLKYPHQIVQTNDFIAKEFPIGVTVTGNQSGTVGTVVKRNLELGQIVLETVGGNNFNSTETISYITVDGVTHTATLFSQSAQYNGVHHYEDADGVWQEPDLYSFDTVNSSWLPVTYRDRLNNKNEELKEIIVLKPSVISKIVEEFSNLHKQVV